MIRLDILSDPVCPWCHIGKAALDRALADAPDHPFTIEWHPFQLTPDMPREGMSRAEFMALKFGPPDAVVRMHAPLLQHAEAAGAVINLPAITRSPNTLDAHRLIHWAGLEGRQSEVVTALFRAYWQDGRDIGDHAVLTDIADRAGLDAGVIARLLATDADTDMIRARDANARAKGVQGVPTFIVDGRYALSGAQTTATWAQVLAELAADADTETGQPAPWHPPETPHPAASPKVDVTHPVTPASGASVGSVEAADVFPSQVAEADTDVSHGGAGTPARPAEPRA